MSPLSLLALGGLAAALSFAGTPLLEGVARRHGILDRPGARKDHEAPVPLLGGLAILAAILLATTLGWALLEDRNAPPPSIAVGILGGAALASAVGLLDDLLRERRGGLAPLPKFLGQATAALLALACGERLRLLGHPVANAAGTVLWLVATTNAFNFLDNMDGLASGLAAVAALSFLAFAALTGQAAIGVAFAVVAGAALGFLPWNYPRARVFLGDAGSHALGFALGALAVAGSYAGGGGDPLRAALLPPLFLALPLLDLVGVCARRFRRGAPLWVGDRLHVSHRLVGAGMSRAGAVATLWAVAGLLGAVALLGSSRPGRTPVLLALGAASVLYAALLLVVRPRRGPTT